MITDAPAKINLSLRVLARESSGYHQIESLFCALDLSDELEIERATDGIEIVVRTDAIANTSAISNTSATTAELNADPRNNLVYKAATAFFEATNLDGGAHIILTKRIPSGAGLGGGSSDAAATLALLNELYARPLEQDAMLQIAARIGSDVPFFLCVSPLALAWGRGTRLLPLPPLAARNVLLVVPVASMSTADAYRALAVSRTDSFVAPAAVHSAARGTHAMNRNDADVRRWADVAYNAVNDFEPVIFSQIPELARIKDDLARHGASIAMMTGSGSVVFGVFDDEARAEDAATAIRADFRNVRTIMTRTGGIVNLFAP